MALQIGAIVNVCADEFPTRPVGCTRRNFCAVTLPDDDQDEKHFLRRIDKGGVLQFIHSRRAHTNVLVHCKRGVSRSAAVVIAYLVRFSGLALDKAYAHVKTRRRCIAPKAGLLTQLVSLELSVHGTSSIVDDRWSVVSLTPKAPSRVLPVSELPAPSDLQQQSVQSMKGNFG
jgi:hypothetical protein